MSQSQPLPVEHRLVIDRGTKHGVVSPLREARTVLGAALSNDIVVHEPVLGDGQIVVSVDAEGSAVECDVPGLHRDAEALEPGRRYEADADKQFTIGRLQFTVLPVEGGDRAEHPAGSSEEPERSFGTSPNTGQVMAAIHHDSDVALNPADSFQHQSRGLSRRLAVVGVALILVAAAGSWSWHRVLGNPAGEQNAIAVLPPAALGKRLSSAGFSELAVRRRAEGGHVIEGYVPSRARLLELERFASVIEPTPRIDVFVQSDIVERVGDVYRTHGIDAIVEPLGNGSVSVLTHESSAPDFPALREAAMQDVQGLQAVSARNQTPAEPLETDRREAKPIPAAQMPPGKRVVAVVAGDPSYVLTEDDARYFVGSSLPSGHTIATIERRSVTLDHEGELTRLEF